MSHTALRKPTFGAPRQVRDLDAAKAAPYRIPLHPFVLVGDGPAQVIQRAAAWLAMSRNTGEHEGRGPFTWDWLGMARACVQAATDHAAAGRPTEDLPDLHDYGMGAEGPGVGRTQDLLEDWGLVALEPTTPTAAGDILLIANRYGRAEIAIQISSEPVSDDAQIIAVRCTTMGVETFVVAGAPPMVPYRWAGE